MAEARSEKRIRTRMLGVRVTPVEHRVLMLAAKEAGMSVGGYVRDAALNQIAHRHKDQP